MIGYRLLAVRIESDFGTRQVYYGGLGEIYKSKGENTMKSLGIIRVTKSFVFGGAAVGLLALAVAFAADIGSAENNTRGRFAPRVRDIKKPAANDLLSGPHAFTVDVAENGNRFVFDETPVYPNGLPAYGGEFVTEGYLYPGGTLNGSNGVNQDGTPEFPNLVIGRWTCRGWHIGDGALTVTGPWVITNQLFDLGEEFGSRSITNEGYELVDLNTPFKRAITGGTGRFDKARGDSTQIFLGFNSSNGVVLRVRFDSIPR